MVDSNFPEYAKELAQTATTVAGHTAFTAEDFVIQTVVLDYGKKSKNPIDFVRFYSKAEQDVARKVQRRLFWRKDAISVPQISSQIFTMRNLRVCSTDTSLQQ